MPYSLENVEETHRKRPWAFSIPRRAEREALSFGALVKLVFLPAAKEDNVHVERMWVRVRAYVSGSYQGALTQRPFTPIGLSEGDSVRFGAEHVAAIEVSPGDPRWIDERKLAVVNRQVMEGGQLPLLVRREPPPDAEHSGWWVLTGEERSAELGDPANFESRPIADLLRKFPALDSVLGEAPRTSWRWDHDALEYREAAFSR